LVNKKRRFKGLYGSAHLSAGVMSSIRKTFVFIKKIAYANDSIYNKSDQYWHKNRYENLSKMG
jgi:hypothetical protein